MYVFVSALSLNCFQFLKVEYTVVRHPRVCLVSTLLLLANRWSPSLRLAGEGGQLAEFIDGLGPGQLVGRQVLGAPALGDIQLSLCYQKGFLEVEVIRARGLQARPNSKVLPGMQCVELSRKRIVWI